MARNDGIDHSLARNGKYTRGQIGNIERHNERKNEIYQNTDIQLERSDMNIYFKKPTDSYISIFDKMCEDGTISTKGLRDNAIHFGELLFDVNTSYFDARGGYEYAREFFSKAYDYAVKEVGGEQYVLSAVMHADERNSAVSQQLDKDVYHYHLHVIYVPVVQKEVKWSKRCKDQSLVGTVKAIITQVSHSKKWASHKEIGEDGKQHLVPSYSLLQDRFFEYMRNCGYHDIERGEKGSTDKHKNDLQFKADQEEKRLQGNVQKVIESEAVLAGQTATLEQNNLAILGQKKQISTCKKQLENIEDKQARIKAIDKIETKQNVFDKTKTSIGTTELENLKILAQKHIASHNNERRLIADYNNLLHENQILGKENRQLSNELYEYKSVKNQLNANKQQLRLAELEKFQNIVYKFLDKLGIRKQFEDFMKMFQRQRNEVER